MTPRNRRLIVVLALTLTVLGVAGTTNAVAQSKPARKKVLVELFVSHGCNLCPKGEQVLGKLVDGNDRVVPLVFHVDYFNKPWKDPFSDPKFSRREWEYSTLFDKKHKIGKPEYLYLTPLLMVGGQVPMVASNADSPDKARVALSRLLSEPVEYDLRMRLEAGADARNKTLVVTAGALSTRAVGNPVLIGAAITEDRLATEVKSGELEGKTYNARHVVRRIGVETVTPQRGRPATLRIPVSLESDWAADRCRVVIFAQDEKTGVVSQADMLTWIEPNTGPAAN